MHLAMIIFDGEFQNGSNTNNTNSFQDPQRFFEWNTQPISNLDDLPEYKILLKLSSVTVVISRRLRCEHKNDMGVWVEIR